MSKITEIIKVIEDSVNSFDKAIPLAQKKMLKQIVKEIQKLEVRDGKILLRASNLKLIAGLRNSLKRIIINDEYLSEVKNFIKAFDVVTHLNNEYFQQFNQKFTPAKTFAIIKQTSIEATINSLTEAGIVSNVVDPVYNLLRNNITTGGSIDDLYQQAQQQVIGDKETPGLLQGLTKQVTTDAINQYSANYNKAISEDLNFTWFRYVGSLLTTSREFCIHMVAKDYYNIKELPEILKGNIDGHHCKTNKKSGLPRGMIVGTNITTFVINRGGYNCGHQVFGIPTSAVPEDVLAKFSLLFPS